MCTGFGFYSLLINTYVPLAGCFTAYGGVCRFGFPQRCFFNSLAAVREGVWRGRGSDPVQTGAWSDMTGESGAQGVKQAGFFPRSDYRGSAVRLGNRLSFDQLG